MKKNFIFLSKCSMSNFHAFHSIENSYREKFLNELKQSPVSSREWCILEKVHGANMSFTYVDGKVLPAKRTSYIIDEKDQQDFNKSKNIIDNITPKILVVKNLLERAYPDMVSFTVYGELFGGFYIRRDKNYQMIQKGVQYYDKHDFFTYDIRIVNANNSSFYLNYDTAISVFDEAGLFYARVLYRGSLNDCLSWSAEHNADQTTIPSYYNLPEIKNNVREGHIIKPVEPGYTYRGNFAILKDKNDLFKEKASTKRGTEYKKVTSELQGIIDEGLLYVTETRLDSVVSKYGLDFIKNNKLIGQLIGLFTKDALDDYYKDHSPILNKKDEKDFNKAVSNACRKLIVAKL